MIIKNTMMKTNHFVRFLCMAFVISVVGMACLSGCRDSREGEVMPDLQLEIQNNVNNAAIASIEVLACDRMDSRGYFAGAEVKASYAEGAENQPLLKGGTYRTFLAGTSIQARNVDPIYLKFSCVMENGEKISLGSVAVSKEECWSGEVKKYTLTDTVVLIPAE